MSVNLLNTFSACEGGRVRQDVGALSSTTIPVPPEIGAVFSNRS